MESAPAGNLPWIVALRAIVDKDDRPRSEVAPFERRQRPFKAIISVLRNYDCAERHARLSADPVERPGQHFKPRRVGGNSTPVVASTEYPGHSVYTSGCPGATALLLKHTTPRSGCRSRCVVCRILYPQGRE